RPRAGSGGRPGRRPAARARRAGLLAGARRAAGATRPARRGMPARGAGHRARSRAGGQPRHLRAGRLVGRGQGAGAPRIRDRAAALVIGGGRGAALSGAAVLLALRAMGAAALAPLAVGAVAAGVGWALLRRRLPDERRHVRRWLERGRAEFARSWRQWLDGTI